MITQLKHRYSVHGDQQVSSPYLASRHDGRADLLMRGKL